MPQPNSRQVLFVVVRGWSNADINGEHLHRIAHRVLAIAIRSKLAHGPCFYRYTGAQQEKGAFVACTFWLAEVYATLGRRKEAEEMIENALRQLPSSMGVLSEQIDITTGDFLGKMPQGSSHLELIHAISHSIRSVDTSLRDGGTSNRKKGPS